MTTQDIIRFVNYNLGHHNFYIDDSKIIVELLALDYEVTPMTNTAVLNMYKVTKR